MLHELVHTIQSLAQIAARIETLQSRHDLPEDITDNLIEETFRSDTGFKAAFEQERELLFRAADEPGETASRLLVKRAVDAIRERQQRYFARPTRHYAELEEFFLSLEGLAVWTHFKLGQLDSRVHFDRGNDPDWVQDEGLAIALNLEKLVAGWQRRLLSPELESPIALLEEVLRERQKAEGLHQPAAQQRTLRGTR